MCEGWGIKLLGQNINSERLYFHSKGKRASVGKADLKDSEANTICSSAEKRSDRRKEKERASVGTGTTKNNNRG